MTAMEKKEEKSEHDRLKQELRRLKRSNAPWYFESALHQRLHGGPPPRARLSPYRVPVAVSLSLGVTALLAVGSYFLLVHTDLFPRSPVVGQTAVKGADTLQQRREVAVPNALPAAARGPAGSPGTQAVVREAPARVAPPPSVSPGGEETIRQAAADTLHRDTLRVRPVQRGRDSTAKAPVSLPDTSGGGGRTP